MQEEEAALNLEEYVWKHAGGLVVQPGGLGHWGLSFAFFSTMLV